MSDGRTEYIWPEWKTVQEIGHGRSGSVYEIRREIFGKKEKAALKVIQLAVTEKEMELLSAAMVGEAGAVEYFKNKQRLVYREYETMMKLRGCTNIVHCDDMMTMNGIGGYVLIKMELLTSLPQAVDNSLSDQLVIQIGKDLCQALLFCEQNGVVHRDIKPQNILVSEDGTWKLGDFSIAEMGQVSDGFRGGTDKYMAPETYWDQKYGPASDLYSLGLVLYWLMNEGRTPFLPLSPEVPTDADEKKARRQRLEGKELPLPRNGSNELKRIVLKACAFRTEERYQNAEEMLYDLRQINNASGKAYPSNPKMTDLTEEESETYVIFENDVQAPPQPNAAVLNEPVISNLAQTPKHKTIFPKLLLLIFLGAALGLMMRVGVSSYRNRGTAQSAVQESANQYGINEAYDSIPKAANAEGSFTVTCDQYLKLLVDTIENDLAVHFNSQKAAQGLYVTNIDGENWLCTDAWGGKYYQIAFLREEELVSGDCPFTDVCLVCSNEFGDEGLDYLLDYMASMVYISRWDLPEFGDAVSVVNSLIDFAEESENGIQAGAYDNLFEYSLWADWNDRGGARYVFMLSEYKESYSR